MVVIYVFVKRIYPDCIPDTKWKWQIEQQAEYQYMDSSTKLTNVIAL